MRGSMVLILVLVEDGLGVNSQGKKALTPHCLNPCFSGGWSRSQVKTEKSSPSRAVLILVLVEDGLGAVILPTSRLPFYCLNPCFSGGWSRRKKRK